MFKKCFLCAFSIMDFTVRNFGISYVGVILRNSKLLPQCMFQASVIEDPHGEPSWVGTQASKRAEDITGEEIGADIVKGIKNLITR